MPILLTILLIFGLFSIFCVLLLIPKAIGDHKQLSALRMELFRTNDPAVVQRILSQSSASADIKRQAHRAWERHHEQWKKKYG
jgi:biopolymer transport protein ExbB/TolQ